MLRAVRFATTAALEMRRLSLVTLVRVARCYRPRSKVCKLALFGLRCPSNSCRRACRDRRRASMTLAGARSTLTQTAGPRSCHLAVLACCRSRTEPSQHIVHVRDMWSWFCDVVRGTIKHVHPSSIVNVYGSSRPIRSQHLPRAHVLRQETAGDDRRFCVASKGVSKFVEPITCGFWELPGTWPRTAASTRVAALLV